MQADSLPAKLSRGEGNGNPLQYSCLENHVLSEEGCEGTPLTPRAFADNVEINVLLAFWPF